MARRTTVSDEEILAAARDAWLDDPRASTAAIARSVGLSEAAIFKRFRTKVRLMLRAFGVHHGPPWVALVASGPDDRPLQVQLDEIATEVDSFFRRMVPRIAVLKGLGISPEAMFGDDEEPPPVVGFRALRDWFERAQTQGLVDPALDAGSLALALIGAFQGRAFWRHMFHDRVPTDDRHYVAHVVDVFCSGLGPRGAS